MDSDNVLKLDDAEHCYDRATLCNWVGMNPTNPMTRADVSADWIHQNCPAAAAGQQPVELGRRIGFAVGVFTLLSGIHAVFSADVLPPQIISTHFLIAALVFRISEPAFREWMNDGLEGLAGHGGGNINLIKRLKRKTRGKRKGPSESCTKFDVGKKKKGNDGYMWKIIKTQNGVKKWKKISGKKKTKKRKKKKNKN